MNDGPIKLDEITPEWVRIEREAIQAYGQPAIAHPVEYSIMIKVVNHNYWQPLQLPRQQTQFADAATRDIILEWLVGKNAGRGKPET